MPFENLAHLLLQFLHDRQLQTHADGRMLFAYNCTQTEYENLRRELSEAIAAAGGIQQVVGSYGPCAAFVLCASEWWKREYVGGQWGWAPLLNSLGIDPNGLSPLQRAELVERGLAFWRLQPLRGAGLAYIGAVVANGGIPMGLLAQGDGPVTQVMSQVLRLASRFDWRGNQVLLAVNERLHLLPNAYRQPQIADLLAQFVDTVRQVKEEYQLGGVADPVARLDAVLPNWRSRFPVSPDSAAAQALLTGLVREAANQGARGLFVAERRLVQNAGTADFALETHLACPQRIPAADLCTMFSLHDDDASLRYFTLDLSVGQKRQPLAEGRLLFGAENPVTVLKSRKCVLTGEAARTELQLIFNHQANDHGQPHAIEGGGALGEDDPWVFVESAAGQQVLVAVGAARLSVPCAWVALAEGWTVESTGQEAEYVGELHSPGLSGRRIFRLRSDARLVSPGVVFRVRLGQPPGNSGKIYQWKGSLLPEAGGRLVFRRGPPRLYWVSEEGLQAIPLENQQWRCIGNDQILQARDARGPIEVRIFDDGEMVARQRIFVLPPNARIEYTSGQNLGVAQVRLCDWGHVECAPEVPNNITHHCTRPAQGSVHIDLSAQGEPPAEFRLHVRWPGPHPGLSLTVPYPVSGGRFVRANGSVLHAQETLSLRELIGMRLQIFDTNPAQPRRYQVSLTLEQGGAGVPTMLPVPMLPGLGRAEIRLLDYQAQIESLLGLVDELDAKVRIGLWAGQQLNCQTRVGRYSVVLQAYDGQIQLPEEAFGRIAIEDLEHTRLLASSLIQPGTYPLDLAPVRSEGVHTGAWVAEGMARELAPWLVYPAPDAAVWFRPFVWVPPNPVGALATEEHQALEPELPNSLPEAMSRADFETRRHHMHLVLEGMGQDHRHPSWPLLDRLWQTFRHLPLTALDVWRILAKQPKTVLSFLLRSELPAAELATVLRRLQREAGWVPELTTVQDLCDASRALWLRWVQDLPHDLAKTVFTATLTDRLQLLANEIPSLGPLIDTAVFAATGIASDLLREVAQVPTDRLLTCLWDGVGSLVNAQLLLVNHDQPIWPRRDFVERHALPAFLNTFPPQRGQAFMGQLTRLFWKFDSWARYCGTQFNPANRPDLKFSVVNLPVLCALWAATSTSLQFWSDPRSRLAFKQIRDFDPIWFEQAYRQAFKICMSIDGLVQLPSIVNQ